MLLAAAAFVTLAPLAPALAQRTEPVPHLMITTFQSSEPGLGVQAAEAIRSRLARDVDAKKLLVIPQKDVHATLTASGYSTTEALQSNDARALANLLRADEYMEGTVTKTPTGVKLEARLVIARDNTIQQPLPPAEGKLDQAAQAVSKAYQSARAQLEGEKTCAFRYREGKYKEAEQAARSALSKYPNGTIAGVCLANALNAQKQTDSVLAITQRIIARDPRNIPALTLVAAIYQERKDPRATETLVSLMAADPSNDKLREQVINDLAQTGQWDKVLPIIDIALKNNPGDPKMLRLAWLVYLGAKKFDLAAQTGAELIKADTSAADTTYFIRTAGALAAQNQFQRAADVFAQGVAKYPTNATLLLSQASALSKAGNNAAALAAARRAVQINPKIDGGYAQIALIYVAMNQSDSVMSIIQLASRNGSDRSTLAKVALAQGNAAYKAGNASKNRADLQKAVDFLKMSDQLEPSSDAKFLMGVSAFTIGQSAITEAQTSKSCSLARLAKDSFATAQENVPAGLQSYPEPAKQVLTAIPQYTPATDEMVKRYCK
ncbi:MAG TPA: tetratricopeptide repeat protein [Gemmatimonadaceae bacterium]|nr:tetratricopeptide repeat protein [Gemmatimonadaceae bacterium]